VWEVKDGAILDFPGNLDDWLYHQRQLAAAAFTSGHPERSEAEAKREAFSSERERKRAEAEARQARYARERPVKDAIARLEARIGELERVQKDAEAALADPALYADFARARPHVDALAAAKGELEGLYAEWEEKQLELERLGAG
jgi:ATP-binding cassette subfamily F protein 3